MVEFAGMNSTYCAIGLHLYNLEWVAQTLIKLKLKLLEMDTKLTDT